MDGANMKFPQSPNPPRFSFTLHADAAAHYFPISMRRLSPLRELSRELLSFVIASAFATLAAFTEG